jgi:ATP-binding cassette subfamily B protein
MSNPPDDDKARRVRSLSALWPFLRPYRRAMGAALMFLLLSASASLVLPAAVGQMIDHGFSQTDAGLIDRYFLALFAVAAVLALATAGRFYFVSWLGERVMADLRRALYGHLLRQELGFFEQTRVGELQSRLTADTELIQTVVGSSASVALRSILLLLGAMVLLVLTSPQLAMLIVIGIPCRSSRGRARIAWPTPRRSPEKRSVRSPRCRLSPARSTSAAAMARRSPRHCRPPASGCGCAPC